MTEAVKALWPWYRQRILLPVIVPIHYGVFQTANSVTFFRLLLTAPIFWYFARGDYWTAELLYWYAVYLDHVDGEVARGCNSKSEFGMIFDPNADKILMVTANLWFFFATPWYWPFLIIPLLAVETANFMIANAKFLLVKLQQKSRDPYAWYCRLRFGLGANRWGKTKMPLQVVGIGLCFHSMHYANPLPWFIAGQVFVALSFPLAISSFIGHVRSIEKV